MTHLTFDTLDQLTAREAFDLFRLRVDVFVAEQNCPFRELDNIDALPDTFHIRAFLNDGTLAACARTFPVEDQGRPAARFGRFVVAPGSRGTGIGPEIVRAAQEFTPRWPGDLIIEAQAGLVGYYNQFGFKEEGEEFLDGTIPHIRMRLRR